MHNPVGSAVTEKVVTKAEVYFPDEIVVDIISRLPAKTALRCRCVCRRWRDLTWRPDFLDLHLRRGAPMILFQNYWYYHGSHMYFIDNWWKPERSVHQEFPIAPPDTKASLYDNFIQFSHDGLIVLKENTRSFIVHNPIYGEYVKISFAEELCGCQMYGVFFHPSLKEYCTLWRIPVWIKGKLEEEHYKMLNLGPNPCWREISNPWVDKSMASRLTVLVDGYLYWMVRPSTHFEIMEFDINNEQFTQIPLPNPVSAICLHNMLNIDNLLSLVEISSSKERVHMNVWTLQDRAKKSWKNCSYNISLGVSPKHRELKPLAVWEGKLFLHVDEDLFVCNLKLGTSRKISLKKISTLCTSFYSHSMSLASLRNCKSKIYMKNTVSGILHE